MRQPPTNDRIIAGLERHGFKILGAGMYSTVLGKGPLVPGARCIKVGTDTTWEPYVIWAQENGFAGNFAPKVFAFHRYKTSNTRHTALFTASMERFTKTARLAGSVLGGLLDYCINNSDGSWDILEARFPGFKCFVKRALHAGFNGDWHSNNWMVHEYPDGRERLILIDPQSAHKAEKAKRWWPEACGIRSQGSAQMATTEELVT